MLHALYSGACRSRQAEHIEGGIPSPGQVGNQLGLTPVHHARHIGSSFHQPPPFPVIFDSQVHESLKIKNHANLLKHTLTLVPTGDPMEYHIGFSADTTVCVPGALPGLRPYPWLWSNPPIFSSVPLVAVTSPTVEHTAVFCTPRLLTAPSSDRPTA